MTTLNPDTCSTSCCCRAGAVEKIFLGRGLSGIVSHALISPIFCAGLMWVLTGGDALQGWAIPTATHIAFALAAATRPTMMPIAASPSADCRALTASLTDTVAGKTIGIFGATYLMARFTKASLDDDLRGVDVAVLAGIGFTVSLLIGELAYCTGSERDEDVKVGVLVGSLLAALLAALILRLRNRTYRRICAEEERDTDTDRTPDVYETSTGI